MNVPAERLKDRAREALPYFLSSLDEPGSIAGVQAHPSDQFEDTPGWILRIEDAARSETGADWPDKHFYGMVVETLLDVIEYGERKWDEDVCTAEELCEEVASDFSVPTLNQELYEWSSQSSEWSDLAHELRDEFTDDEERELELLEEAMGNDVDLLRRAVLNTLLTQLLEEEEEV